MPRKWSIRFVVSATVWAAIAWGLKFQSSQGNSRLKKQLTDFKHGHRQNEEMAPFLPFLKFEDIPGLGVYFADQKPTPWQVQDAKLANVGRKIFEDGNSESGLPACAGCHQSEALGNGEFPRLASQSKTYILRQLTLFKNGIRKNDRGSLMQAVTSGMTGEEMKAVAEYLAGLQ
jgi:cytochrome c553